jgi:hypothetical protein
MHIGSWLAYHYHDYRWSLHLPLLVCPPAFLVSLKVCCNGRVNQQSPRFKPSRYGREGQLQCCKEIYTFNDFEMYSDHLIRAGISSHLARRIAPLQLLHALVGRGNGHNTRLFRLFRQ